MTSPQAPGSPPKSPNAWAVIAIVAAFALAAAYLGSKGNRPPPAPSTLSAPLATPTALPGEAKPANTAFMWDEEEDGPERTFNVDGLVLTLSARLMADGRAPLIKVTGPKQQTVELVGETRPGAAYAEIGVGKLDAASPHSQVLFTSFSGGAHCCAVIQVLDYLGGQWKSIEIAVQDGDRLGAFPNDLDGDGQREFELTDGRFLYAFESYAGSRAPSLIKALENGVLRDVSKEKRFRPTFEAYMNEVEPECLQRSNGPCAAFVAAAARAGTFEAAWQTMLASYDTTSDWTFPTACRVAAGDSGCPPGQEIAFASFPESLRWFLGDAGYIPAVYIPGPDESGPSFDCKKVSGDVPLLICATPELAAADRQLAWLYWRALARSTQPEALQIGERNFLEVRDSSPPDVFTLLRLYQARIATLADALGE